MITNAPPDGPLIDKGHAMPELPEIFERLDRLRQEGHGPQRHHDPSDAKLAARMGNPVMDSATGRPVLKGDGHVRSADHVDPMTGTTNELSAAAEEAHRFFFDEEPPGRGTVPW